MIHGITPEMVADAPLYPAAMAGVYDLIGPGTLLVAHNAAFDFSVLRHSYKNAPAAIPDLLFSCTYRLASRLLPASVSYTLPDVADALGISGLDHHNASSDAEICGRIFLAMLSNYPGVDEMMAAANLNYGTIFAGEYDGIHKLEREHTGVSYDSRLSLELPDFTVGPDSPFYGKTVVFTGTLASMLRSDAENIILQIGGHVASGVSKKTDFLVTGYQDPRVLKGHEKSIKVLAAEKLLSKGHRIEVIPEEDFLKLL